MNDKAVLLLGSYGQTNLGDDMLMYNYVELLRQRGFNRIYVNVSVAANIPAVITRGSSDIVPIPTYGTSLLGWLKIIRSVNCVIYGGGTVFKELYSSTGRGRYSVIVRIMFFNLLAKLLDRPIYYLHIGVGVVKTGLGRAITRSALAAARVIIFRDDQSFLFAHDALGLPAKKLCLATDGLFINDLWQEPRQPINLRLPKNKLVVGVNFLSDIPDWVDRGQYVSAIKTFVSGLVESGYFVLLVPFQHSFNPNNDYVFMRREFNTLLRRYPNIKLLKSLPIEQAVSVFKRLDIFVGMRFHSLLLATSAATPFLALAYDIKCWRFIEENEYPHALRIEDISADHLKESFKHLLANRRNVPPVLRKIATQQLKRGQQCIDHLDF